MVPNFQILYEVAPELARKDEDEVSLLWRDFVNNYLDDHERRWLMVPLTVDNRLTLQSHFSSWWGLKRAGLPIQRHADFQSLELT